eukprot:329715_1
MDDALKELDSLISKFISVNVAVPEIVLHEYIYQYLTSSSQSCISVNELHSLMQHHDHHRHSIYKRKKKSKERSIPEMIRSLHCIDGMDIRFPWKTRHKKFIDFVLSVPGLLIQLDHNNKHQVSIDYRANVAPFLNTIHRLPLNDCIRKHLLSNEVRKNKKYKFMKRHTNMYKNELEICRLLQNIHFNVDCPANTNKCDKLFIVNLRTMYSINLDQMLKSIQRNATVRFPRA